MKTNVARNIPHRQPKRIRNIVADADALGVNRIHLWKVLTGRRESRRLLRRYNALKRGAK